MTVNVRAKRNSSRVYSFLRVSRWKPVRRYIISLHITVFIFWVWRSAKAIKKIHVWVALEVLSRGWYCQRSHLHETLHSLLVVWVCMCAHACVCMCMHTLASQNTYAIWNKFPFGIFLESSHWWYVPRLTTSLGLWRKLPSARSCTSLFGLVNFKLEEYLKDWRPKLISCESQQPIPQLFGLMENHFTTQQTCACHSQFKHF